MDANLIDQIAEDLFQELDCCIDTFYPDYGFEWDKKKALGAIKSACEKVFRLGASKLLLDSDYEASRAAATHGHEWKVKALDDDGKGFGFAVVDETGKEIMRSLSRFECDRTAAAALRLAAATTSGAVSNELLDQARAAATVREIAKIDLKFNDLVRVGVFSFYTEEPENVVNAINDAHNAAIAAEREQLEIERQKHIGTEQMNKIMFEKQLAAMRQTQDTERLDWLEANPIPAPEYEGQSWREAIDAAMQARQKKEKE